MTEREQDYSNWAPEDLNREFLQIFELVPPDLPGTYYTGSKDKFEKSIGERQRSELKAIMSIRLEKLLDYALITDYCKKFFQARFENHFIYGMKYDESSKLFKSLLETIETKEGIFGEEESAEIETAAYYLYEFTVDDVQVELNAGRASADEIGSSIFEGRKTLEEWKMEYFERYGEEVTLPISQ